MRLYLTYTLLNFADITLTYFGMTQYGYGEANPVVASAIANHGYSGMVLLALITQWVVAYIARRFGKVSLLPMVGHVIGVTCWVGLVTGYWHITF
jgi:hypothetical protein